MSKIRLDDLLVEKKLADTRSQARALILSGHVSVDGNRIDKAGTKIAVTAEITIKQTQKYVSRGGLKLEKALQEFSISVDGKSCLDVGASTGGFTDCLLQNGASQVFAVDVGYGQMHWKLQSDARVVRLDRENFRHFDITKITKPIDVSVMDVSFISIKLLIPKLIEVLRVGAGRCVGPAPTGIFLIKPQFEVGPENVGKGGIVRDEKIREKAVESIKNFLIQHGFKNLRITPSPITGADGNVEYLMAGEFGER
jgi:23S rRNA (cytidine1920-2'-O)/16S rRNA (cytidine1409-2'-O)-methyltransferase